MTEDHKGLDNRYIQCIKKSSQSRQPKYFHTQLRRFQKFYTETGARTSIKKSQNDGTLHRHLNTVHPSSNSHVTYKSKQQVLQQNFCLKNENNSLKKDITMQKVHNENQRRKNKNITLKLNRQFKKDLYYSTSQNLNTGGSLYMVTGIKNQYQKIKQEYTKLLGQMEEIKRTDHIQQLNQLKIYSLALEQENKRLAQRLNIIKTKVPESDLEKQQVNYYQLQNKMQRLSQKNKTLKESLKQLKNQDNQNRKVIDFLEKLIIDKSNAEYNAKKLATTLQRKNQDLQKRLKSQESQTDYLVKQYQSDMARFKQSFDLKIEKQSDDNKKILFENKEIIRKLQKQITSLNMILSYWKPNREDEHNSSQIRQSSKQKSENMENPELNKSMGVNIGDNESRISLLESTKIRPQAEGNSYRDSKEKTITPIGKVRRKTSGIKHSENSKKFRKVTVEQTQELAQHIKYRLIGRNIQIDQIKNFFNSQEKKLDAEQDYITYKQLYLILHKQPFLLKDSEAQLLARYIVEDQCWFEKGNTSNAFVYFDKDNQISRRIAKSIIRAFVNSYELPNKNQCQQKWKNLMQKFHNKLQTILISIAPSGQITRDRWNDVIVAMMNAEVSDTLKQWLIGIMLVESENLQKLKYKTVIQNYISK